MINDNNYYNREKILSNIGYSESFFTVKELC